MEYNALTPTFINAFRNRITKDSSGCWLWTHGRTTAGYGQLRVPGFRKNYLAHRIAYLIATKNWPGDKLVCHSCDRRNCVNPDHLFLGTHQDNANDMKTKGRSHVARGVFSSHATLLSNEVTQIRESTLKQSTLASKYGVNQSTISRIKSGSTW
jgi:hypothetical protein